MTVWGLRLYLNFKQAVGSENIYGVFNVFVKKSVSICEYLWENKYTIRMVNSLYSSYSCSKIYHPHGYPCSSAQSVGE